MSSESRAGTGFLSKSALDAVRIYWAGKQETQGTQGTEAETDVMIQARDGIVWNRW